MTNRPGTFLGLLLCVLITSHITWAQFSQPANKVWKFGRYAGINFGTTPPTPFQTGIPIASMEGAASICDANGNFLFHTEGTNIWNANDVLMPHGTGLTSFPNNPTVSTSQSAVIVPVPDSAGQYFVFSLPEWSFSASFGKLFMNKVKMSLNNGLGDVDTTFPLRHVILDSLYTEKMTVVPGCGHSWLLLYKRDSTGFRAHKITKDGLDNNPVVSAPGLFPNKHYRQGMLKASHDGKLLVNSLFKPNISAGDGVELYDFDPLTGVVSNARVLDAMSSFSAEFSPDNSKLYVHFAGTLTTSAIYQFDLSLANWADVVASKTLLGYCSAITDIRLAPDSVIYFNRQFQNTNIIGSINHPNLTGAAADFRDTTFTLPGIAKVYYGFPQTVIIDNAAGDSSFNLVLDTLLCPISDSVTLSTPDGAYDIQWSNGSTGSSISVWNAGTYYVSYATPCPVVDTFLLRREFPQWFITINEKILGTSYAFDSYQWYKGGQLISGATNATYEVQENGVYSVEVSLNSCADTQSYLVTSANSIDDLERSITIEVYPVPFKDELQVVAKEALDLKILDLLGRTVLTAKQKNVLPTAILPPGVYLLEARTSKGKLIQVKKIIKQD